MHLDPSDWDPEGHASQPSVALVALVVEFPWPGLHKEGLHLVFYIGSLGLLESGPAAHVPTPQAVHAAASLPSEYVPAGHALHPSVSLNAFVVELAYPGGQLEAAHWLPL